MSSYIEAVKPSALALQSTRILDPLRERIRHKHYSVSTEKAYLHWVRFFCSVVWPQWLNTAHLARWNFAPKAAE